MCLNAGFYSYFYFVKMQMSLGNNKINGQESVFFSSCFKSGVSE